MFWKDKPGTRQPVRLQFAVLCADCEQISEIQGP
jgi:hypothetical protein